MTIEFRNDSQKACYEKILPWIKEIFGELSVVPRGDVPVIDVIYGSAVVQVMVFPWDDDNCVISCASWVVMGAEATPELLLYLLQENSTMRFGAFSMDKDKDISFEYDIVGDTVDREELKAAVVAVAVTADSYDEKIVERFGGTRARDRG